MCRKVKQRQVSRRSKEESRVAAKALQPAVLKVNTKINNNTNKKDRIRTSKITSKEVIKAIKKEVELITKIKIGKEVKVLVLIKWCNNSFFHINKTYSKWINQKSKSFFSPLFPFMQRILLIIKQQEVRPTFKIFLTPWRNKGDLLEEDLDMEEVEADFKVVGEAEVDIKWWVEESTLMECQCHQTKEILLHHYSKCWVELQVVLCLLQLPETFQVCFQGNLHYQDCKCLQMLIPQCHRQWKLELLVKKKWNKEEVKRRNRQ